MTLGQISEKEVRGIQMTAIATDSFCPIPHSEALDYLYEGMERAKMRIKDNPRFTVTAKGTRLFGTFNLEEQINEDAGLMIGFANSFDKSLSMKIGFGSKVFVCSNGCFFAERVIGRRHTLNIREDIADLIDKALSETESYRDAQAKFFDRLKSIKLQDDLVNDMSVRICRDAKVISKGGILDLVEEFHNPQHREFNDYSAWGFHNAVTEISKNIANSNGVAHSDRMIALTKFLHKEFAYLN